MSLEMLPSVRRQSGADMQRQYSEKNGKHSAVEVVRVLYSKLLPFQRHPGGYHVSDLSLATVSLNPKLVAAASHDALSKMAPLPLTSEHLEMMGVGYPYGPTSFFRHDPPPTVE